MKSRPQSVENIGMIQDSFAMIVSSGSRQKVKEMMKSKEAVFIVII